MLGRTVTLPKPAERIVTLYSEPYAQILALGLMSFFLTIGPTTTRTILRCCAGGRRYDGEVAHE
jgi:hypothetical protein